MLSIYCNDSLKQKSSCTVLKNSNKNKINITKEILATFFTKKFTYSQNKQCKMPLMFFFPNLFQSVIFPAYWFTSASGVIFGYIKILQVVYEKRL